MLYLQLQILLQLRKDKYEKIYWYWVDVAYEGEQVRGESITVTTTLLLKYLVTLNEPLRNDVDGSQKLDTLFLDKLLGSLEAAFFSIPTIVGRRSPCLFSILRFN